MKQEYVTLLTAIATALAGSKLWDWLQKRSELKLEKEKTDENRLVQYRDDLRERVAKLEGMLDSQNVERTNLLQQIGQLTAELSAMKVKLEFLERENSLLRNRLNGETQNEQ